MPVVEETACRTAAKTDDEITYSLSYQPAAEDREGYLSASNTVGIAYGDCSVGGLRRAEDGSRRAAPSPASRRVSHRQGRRDGTSSPPHAPRSR